MPTRSTGTDWVEAPTPQLSPFWKWLHLLAWPPLQALGALAPDIALYQVVFLHPGHRSIDNPSVELASNYPVGRCHLFSARILILSATHTCQGPKEVGAWCVHEITRRFAGPKQGESSSELYEIGSVPSYCLIL